MSTAAVRATWLGFAAIIGYVCLLFVGAMLVMWLSALFGSILGSSPYCIAFGMGVLQLILVLWGAGRIMAGVRIDRRWEYPSEES